jgi:hypothetical protein
MSKHTRSHYAERSEEAPTPPPSDAIAPSDAAIAQAFREISPRQFAKATHFHEYVLGRARLLDSGEMPWHQEWANVQSRNESARQRAREIAAQPGEGVVAVGEDAIREVIRDLRGWRIRSPWPCIWANKLEKALLDGNHPPHVADALDGERYRWLRSRCTDKLCVRALADSPTHANAYYQVTGKELDRTIDAELAATESPK